MMMRSIIFAPLLVSAAARLAQRDVFESPLDAKTGDAPEVTYAMQDLQDAMQIKGQFNNFLDRVSADNEKLHSALESQGSKISDLELEKQSLQQQMQSEKARLSHELEVFKQKMIAKITDLKTTNRRLEETNMQLVSSNEKLTAELEAEKGKTQLLVKKLKKMATMFDKQQQSVQNIIQQNSQRIENEVNSDVSEAVNTANDGQAEAMAPPQYTAPIRTPVATSNSDEELDALKLPPGLDDEEDEAPQHSFHPAPKPEPVVAPQPKAGTQGHGGEIKKAVSAAASSAAANARKAVEAAAKKAKATADAKVQAEAPKRKPAPVAPSAPKAGLAAAPAAGVAPPASKVPLASADDEQLKSLRAEVERLESSVKNDDSEAPAAASMLHVTKKTAKVAAQVKPEEASDSVKKLEDVGGMLSEAMAADDDDN